MEVIKCDIIVAGSGMAGLSLLYRAMKEGIWLDKKVVVVDREPKQSNDKTWSFWKKEVGPFDHLIQRCWKDMVFFSNTGEEIKLDTSPYTYNSIRSLDFYNSVLDYLLQFKNITFYHEEVLSTGSEDNGCFLITNTRKISSAFLFNSIYIKPEFSAKDQYFLQHFKGYKIRSSVPILDPSSIYLMDFRTPQENGTTFVYTLPEQNEDVFVEYTVFSKGLLEESVYDRKLRTYIEEVLKCEDYIIVEEEFGVIPMTDYAFKRRDGNVVNIGSMGGDTRGSTGYTFMNTQKAVSQILKSFKRFDHPFDIQEPMGLKEKLYDSTLLNVLAKEHYKGHQLFRDLFKNTKARIVFKFLDGETTLLDDVHIMWSLNKIPFIRQFVAAILRKI